MSAEGIDTHRAIDRMLTVFDQQQGINEKMLAMVAAWDQLDDDLRAADIVIELREGSRRCRTASKADAVRMDGVRRLGRTR
jgi:hypothetical protein